MTQLIQFKLSAADEEQTFEALGRSSERNLNLFAKRVFLDFVKGQGDQANTLGAINDQLTQIRQSQQDMSELLRAADPDTLINIMAALFLLLYRSTDGKVREELDAVFNSKFLIDYLKE